MDAPVRVDGTCDVAVIVDRAGNVCIYHSDRAEGCADGVTVSAEELPALIACLQALHAHMTG